MAKGLIKLLNAIFHSNKQNFQIMEEGHPSSHAAKSLLLGGIVGGVVGMATALLLAPKSGADLVNDLIEPLKKHPKKKTKVKERKAKTPKAKQETTKERKTGAKKPSPRKAPSKKNVRATADEHISIHTKS